MWAGVLTMGGALSGRRCGGPVVEDCITIDLAQLMRLGAVLDGHAVRGALDWQQDGQDVASVAFRLDLRQPERAALVLAFRLGSDGQAVAQRIGLAFTVPQFGGRRWWLICPVTGERVRCLHLAPGGTRFASRRALGLSYRVERLGQFDRPFARLHREQRRMGHAGGWGSLPERRKGIWKRTHERHLARLAALDASCGAAVLELMGRRAAA